MNIKILLITLFLLVVAGCSTPSKCSAPLFYNGQVVITKQGFDLVVITGTACDNPNSIPSCVCRYDVVRRDGHKDTYPEYDLRELSK